MKTALAGVLLSVLVASNVPSCHRSKPTTRYRVEGIIAETSSAGPYRPAEVGEIMDSHGDQYIPRRYGSLVKLINNEEQVAAVRQLIDVFSTPRSFRRVIETRRGLNSFESLAEWLGHDTMKKTKRIVVEATITREAVIRDLPLVERVLNVPSDVDDEYEALRRAVLLDSETLAKSKARASSARLWLCVRSALAQSITISIFSKNAAYAGEVADRICANSAGWMQRHLIDARVSECHVLSAGDTLVMKLDGALGVRVEMLPILSSKDGTLVIISDPEINVDRIFR